MTACKLIRKLLNLKGLLLTAFELKIRDRTIFFLLKESF